MSSLDAALLATLADCLEAGDSLAAALAKVTSAGGRAASLAHRVRTGPGGRGAPGEALQSAGLLDAAEASLVDADATVSGAALRVVAARRLTRAARRRAILRGLVGPLAIAALTVVLDPLPNLVGEGSYVGPVLRGLFELAALALAVVVGFPALMRDARLRAALLRASAALPGFRRLARLHAEAELCGGLAPFAAGSEVSASGLVAAASLVAWSPLGAALRALPAPAGGASGPPSPMGALAPVTHQLSPEISLAVVGGVASGRLAERFEHCAETRGELLTARLRLLSRVGAYALVVALSITSLIGMISRGLPGMPVLPGGDPSNEQKELEELLKQLQQ